MNDHDWTAFTVGYSPQIKVDRYSDAMMQGLLSEVKKRYIGLGLTAWETLVWTDDLVILHNPKSEVWQIGIRNKLLERS